MIAIKNGTTAWRQAEKLEDDEVEFKGGYLYEENGLTPAMVWDDKLGNVRPKTDKDREAEGVVEQARIEAQVQAILDGTDQSPMAIAFRKLMRSHIDAINKLNVKNGLPEISVPDVVAKDAVVEAMKA